MNELEKLVPLFAECKLIPQGSFPDTALVWLRPITAWLCSFEDKNLEDPYYASSYEIEFRSRIGGNGLPVFSAPSLEEIAKDTPGGIVVNFDEHYVESLKYDSNGESMHESWTDKENAATAALRLWQRIRKAESEA